MKVYVPVLSLYDNEGDLSGVTGAGGTMTQDDAALAAAAAQAAEEQLKAQQAAAQQAAAAAKKDDLTVGGDPNARFTQDQVNKIVQDRLAKDRKKQEDERKTVEQAYQDLLAKETLSEEEREALAQQLEDLRKQHRTKEQQAVHERKQLQEEYNKRIEELQQAAVVWEDKYKTSLVNRSLMDAAVKHDSFMPDQVVTILREMTKLVQPVDENGKTIADADLVPMVDLPDVDADSGAAIITQRTPDEAVERLKELQPNLFRANVVSGVGGNSTTGGVTPGADGTVDVTQLTPEQFIKLYREDPSKVGLRKRRTI